MPIYLTIGILKKTEVLHIIDTVKNKYQHTLVYETKEKLTIAAI
jgi:hypothetical protein